MFGGTGKGLQIFRWRGVPVTLDITVLLLVALYVIPLATQSFPNMFRWNGLTIWLAAFGVAGVAVGSILVHEMSHAIVGVSLGGKVTKIELHLFGGATYFSSMPRSNFASGLVSIAGPASNLALAALGWWLTRTLDPGTVGRVLSDYLLGFNVLLAVFNILPGYPMDGGQALRSFLFWATRREQLAALVTMISGCVVGAGILAYALFNFLPSGSYFNVALLGIVAYWIISGSIEQYRSTVAPSVVEPVAPTANYHDSSYVQAQASPFAPGFTNYPYPQPTTTAATAVKTQTPLSAATRSFRQGVAYLQSGQSGMAIGQFSLAIQYKPNYAHQYLYRAVAYFAAGNYQAAVTDCDCALRLSQAQGQNPALIFAVRQQVLQKLAV